MPSLVPRPYPLTSKNNLVTIEHYFGCTEPIHHEKVGSGYETVPEMEPLKERMAHHFLAHLWKGGENGPPTANKGLTIASHNRCHVPHPPPAVSPFHRPISMTQEHACEIKSAEGTVNRPAQSGKRVCM